MEINKDEKCGICGATGLKWVDATHHGGYPTHKILCPGEEYEEHDIIKQKQNLLYSGLPTSVNEELKNEIAGLRAAIHQRLNIKQNSPVYPSCLDTRVP